MVTSIVQSKAAVNHAGAILRQWRGSRGKTQLDLSFDSGISQKHISFVESGRSTPSRQTLLDLAQALEIPLREQNTLLLAAGYAPVHSQEALDAPAMTSITKALKRMLHQHEPFPAIVMDRHWNVLMTNDAEYHPGRRSGSVRAMQPGIDRILRFSAGKVQTRAAQTVLHRCGRLCGFFRESTLGTC